MKKILAVMLTFSLLVSTSIISSANDFYCNEAGAVVIEFENKNLKEKDAFLSVFKGESWEALRNTTQYENLSFFAPVAFDDKGMLEVTFGLENSGEYRYFMNGLDVGEADSKEGMIYYINTSKRDAANTALKDVNLSDETAAKASISEIVGEHIFDFGLFNGLYNSEISSDAGSILYESIDNAEEAEAHLYVQKAYLAAMVNAGTLTNIDTYKNSLGLAERGIDAYWNKPEIITEKLKLQNYTDVETFDETIMSTLIGIAVEYGDSVQGIEDIIAQSTDYLTASAIRKLKNSETMCAAMMDSANKAQFYTYEGIENYITSYTEPSGGGNGGGFGGGSGGSSGGGGGGTAVKPSSPLAGTEVVIGIDDKKDEVEEQVFTDVAEQHWAKDMIEELYYDGIIAGKTDDTFCPEDTITREEFVKLLVSAVNLNTFTDTLPFSDVKKDDWYYTYVNAAYSGGIVNGISNNSFGSGRKITRQDLAVMTYNTIKQCNLKLEAGADEGKFKDEVSFADYSVEAVNALKDAGILSGDSDGLFRPTDNTTRAEAAKIIYMLRQLL